MKHQAQVEKAKIALLAMQRYSWDQGVAGHAMIDLEDCDMAIAMAKEAVYRQVEDGRSSVIGVNNAVTDPCTPGECIVYAYEQTNDPYFKDGLDRLLAWVFEKAPRSDDGILYHVMDAPQMWSDSTYMLPPFLAAAGYPEQAVEQMVGYWKYLYCPQKKLFHHMWNHETKVYDRADFWGGGNGWALAGVARMLKHIPDSMTAQREQLIAMEVELLDSCLGYIRPDGLSHDILDDASSFVETNFSQMCAYAIYVGVADGWLDRTYLEMAHKMRAAANEKMDVYGLVQDSCGAPTFSGPGVSPESQAFYLLMEKAAQPFDCET